MAMRYRVLLTGAVLAVLTLVAVAVYPVAGRAGIGDGYFPLAGNGGFDVQAYDIRIRYDPRTDRIEGHTTITARATESLSRFDLDLRLPASAVTVNGRPARIHQDKDELQVTPGSPVLVGARMTVHVDYEGVPSDIPAGPDRPSPWVHTIDGAVAVGEPDIVYRGLVVPVQ
jgi:hypothetical protein